MVYTGPAPGFPVLDASERWRLGSFASVHEGCFRNLCEARMGLVQVISSGSHQLQEKPGLFVCFILVVLASTYSDMALRAWSWLSGSGLSEKEGQGSRLQQRMVRGKTLELGHQEDRCQGQ